MNGSGNGDIPASFLMMPERLERTRFEVGGHGVGTVTLCRPEKLNAFDWRMIAELRSIVWRATFDDEVRVLVITGAGRGFCAGRDIGELRWERGMESRKYRAYVRANHEMFDDLERLEKPVIAAINGPCAGGGVEMAVSCDFRVASPSATFLLPEKNIGVIPASGACSRMIQMIGIGRVKEMVMTGATYSAEQAEAMGLLNRIAADGDVLREAGELAAELMRGAPEAVGLAKSVINACQDVDTATGRQIERLAQSKLVSERDADEGLAAFLSKRDPEFDSGQAPGAR